MHPASTFISSNASAGGSLLSIAITRNFSLICKIWLKASSIICLCSWSISLSSFGFVRLNISRSTEASSAACLIFVSRGAGLRLEGVAGASTSDERSSSPPQLRILFSKSHVTLLAVAGVGVFWGATLTASSHGLLGWALGSVVSEWGGSASIKNWKKVFLAGCGALRLGLLVSGLGEFDGLWAARCCRFWGVTLGGVSVVSGRGGVASVCSAKNCRKVFLAGCGALLLGEAIPPGLRGFDGV